MCLNFVPSNIIAVWTALINCTLIMVYKSHLIRATLDALDFLEIFQEP